MRFTTKTEYGLVCLMYMARHTQDGKTEHCTIKELSGAEEYSPAYTEKILQALRGAGIVTAHHGNQGGYTLARPAAEIKVKEIIEALEGSTFDVFCEPDVRKEITCTHFSFCGVKPLWEKSKDVLNQFYSYVTLDMLMRNAMQSAEVTVKFPDNTPVLKGKENE